MNIVNVQIRQNLIRQAMPDPFPIVRLPLRPIVQQLVIHIQRLVPPPVSPALNLVERSRASHANVDSDVNLVALVCVPEAGHEVPHHLVVDADGLRVDEDADGRQLLCRSGVGVLSPKGREV